MTKNTIIAIVNQSIMLLLKTMPGIAASCKWRPLPQDVTRGVHWQPHMALSLGMVIVIVRKATVLHLLQVYYTPFF